MEGSEGVAPEASPPRLRGRVVRAQARFERFDRGMRATRPVRGFMAIMDTYGAAGGGLTANGLAYSALFAVVPGLLLVVSLLVIVVGDRTAQQEVIDWLIAQVPPLAEVAEAIVTGLAQSARVGSVLGLIGFLWGSSGFYLGLEAAMERLFPGPGSRDPIRARIRGVIAVVVVVGAILTAFIVSSVASIVWTFFPDAVRTPVPLATPLVAIAASTFVALTVYLLVPTDAPHWRAALPPSILAGVGIGMLTSLFGLVAPLLVGGFRGLGAIASVFVALVWFHWVFQILLYCGAFARMRRDQRHVRGLVR